MVEIQWPRWEKIINVDFIPYVKNRDRYLIMYGGRGSSKSDFTAKKLIFRCLTENYFRYILVRNEYNKIKDSQYQTIKDIVYSFGLESLFQFRENPFEIRCVNGNKFLARGLDDAKKLKSIKDPTGVWYEEEIPDYDDFITVSTSIRTGKADYLQEIFTINPEVDGDYLQHWFFKKFFKKHYPQHLTFSDEVTIEVKDIKVVLSYSVMHSTYQNNRWLPNEFIAQLLQIKEDDEYYYTVYTLGLWGHKKLAGIWAYEFKNQKHISENAIYEPLLPVNLVFDFNVNPATCNMFQMTKDRIWQFAEIHLQDASIYDVLERIKSTFGSSVIMRVSGDASGWAREKATFNLTNMYEIIQRELYLTDYAIDTPRVNPELKWSRTLVNYCLKNKNIEIHPSCQFTISDLSQCVAKDDGTIDKSKQNLTHHLDAFKYFFTTYFGDELNQDYS